MNWSERVKALWDNRQLIQFKTTPYLVMVGVFWVALSLISSPHYLGISQGIGRISQLQNIEQSFQEAYNDSLPCAVNEWAVLVCEDNETVKSYGDYEWIFGDSFNIAQTTQSTVYLGSTRFVAVYVNHNDIAYLLEGDYRLLVGFDFQSVNTLPNQNLMDHHNEQTDAFLSAIYHSATDEKIIFVFISQAFQTVIYVFVLTFVFLLLNLDYTRKKINVIESNKLMIAGMVGPALATAIIGLLYPGLGSIIFPFIYGFRMMIVYFYLRKHREKITNFK